MMDEDTRASLAEIKADVRNGFTEIKSEIKELVTRGEFSATVQRIDSESAALRRDLTAHEEAAPIHRKAALDKAEAVRTEVRSELESFRVTTRWAITLAATGAAILVSALTWFVNYITPSGG